MELFETVSVWLAAIALGLSAGALLAEGAVLVPFWRSLPPASFLDWYRRHAALLLKFFGPLEVAAAVLAVAAAGLGGRGLSILAAVLAVAVLAAFPLYFKQVNAQFAAGTIAADRVAAELGRWSSWHWARTAVATAAFVAAIGAVRS